MGYFPFFVELENVPGLIVGGGTVALRKVEKLAPYGPRLTVCAPEIRPEIQRFPQVTIRRQPFQPQLLETARFVIAAGEPDLNRRVSRLCRERGIPVNAVDDRSHCSFLFPSLVRRGSLSVGISTGGASPTAAIWLRRQIEDLLPENFDAILACLDSLRTPVRQAVPEESRRAGCFARLFSSAIQAGRPLTEAEVQEILGEYTRNGRNDS